MAITDHDTIRGALEVEEELAGEGPEVVIGTEVTSSDGHILALFVDRDVPSGLSAARTVDVIHPQGGLAVAAHPYSVTLGVGNLALTLDFDAVEVMNGSPLMNVANAVALRRLRGQSSALVGGSDAHVTSTLGTVCTLFTGRCAADLRAAMLAGLTRPAVAWARHVGSLPAHIAWLAWLPLQRRVTGRLGFGDRVVSPHPRLPVERPVELGGSLGKLSTMPKKGASQSKVMAKLSKRISQLSKERKKIAQITRDIEQLRGSTDATAGQASSMASAALDAELQKDGATTTAGGTGTPKRRTSTTTASRRSTRRRTT